MTYLAEVFCGNYRHNPLILCENIAVFAIHSNRIHLEEKRRGEWGEWNNMNYIGLKTTLIKKQQFAAKISYI